VLSVVSLTLIECGDYADASELLDEVFTLSHEKGASFWNAFGMNNNGCVLTLTGRHADAVEVFTSGIAAYKSTGATVFSSWWTSQLALAYAQLGQFEHSSRCMSDALAAIDVNKECWCEAEINRIAAEIALCSYPSARSVSE
jgi:hypothetical protein